MSRAIDLDQFTLTVSHGLLRTSCRFCGEVRHRTEAADVADWHAAHDCVDHLSASAVVRAARDILRGLAPDAPVVILARQAEIDVARLRKAVAA